MLICDQVVGKFFLGCKWENYNDLRRKKHAYQEASLVNLYSMRLYILSVKEVWLEISV